MADIGTVAAKRQEILGRVLGKLGMDLVIPPTKAQPIVMEKFYLDIIAEIAGRVVVLEATLRRANERNERRIAELEEVVTILLNRREALEASVADVADSVAEAAEPSEAEEE